MPPSRFPMHRPRRPAARGFTMLELMVGLAVAAILLRLAAPSVASIYRGNRVQTESSQFVSDMQYARSEAIRRGLPVTLCPSSDGSACIAKTAASANDWAQGWIVFHDQDGNGTVDSGDTVLRKRAAFTGGDTFVATDGSSNAIPRVTYNREGFTTTPNAAALFTLHTAATDTHATRCVTVDFGGRAAVISYGQKNLASTLTCN